MKQNTILLIAFLLLCGTTGICQSRYQALKVGDQMPDYVLQNLINYPTSEEKISAFRGKLLILDFWNTGCRGCILSWPKLLELQNEFTDKIQIILVNPYQGEEAVRNAVEMRRKLADVNMTLPMVCGDTVLGNQLFPHRGVPHIVWIDGSGTVQWISDGQALTKSNVWRMLASDPTLSRIPKIENRFSPRLNKPLFLNGNGGPAADVFWQSILTKRKDSLISRVKLTSDSLRGFQATCLNRPVIDLYRLAYSYRSDPYYDMAVMLPLSRVILEVENPDLYTRLVDGNVNYENLYVYHLFAPPSSRSEIQAYMQEDLRRYFGLQARWEKRKMECLVLSATDTTKIAYKSGPIRYTVPRATLTLNKVPVSRFIHDLETATRYYYSPYPILDETNLKGLLGGIEVQVDIEDHVKLDRALRQYGMRFTVEERLIEVLILSDGEPSSPASLVK